MDEHHGLPGSDSEPSSSLGDRHRPQMSHRRCGQRDVPIVVGDGHLFHRCFGLRLMPKQLRVGLQRFHIHADRSDHPRSETRKHQEVHSPPHLGAFAKHRNREAFPKLHHPLSKTSTMVSQVGVRLPGSGFNPHHPYGWTARGDGRGLRLSPPRPIEARATIRTDSRALHAETRAGRVVPRQ